eukprot:765990-Hanusia_phi.AAC.6
MEGRSRFHSSYLISPGDFFLSFPARLFLSCQSPIPCLANSPPISVLPSPPSFANWQVWLTFSTPRTSSVSHVRGEGMQLIP